MKKITNKLSTLLLIMLMVVQFKATAQREPQVQDKPVRAPRNVKIDGKMTEWANTFLNKDMTDGFLSAYNSSSRVFYTVANDDNNLYVVVRGLGNGVAQKMMSGGFVFTVSHYTDSKRKKAPDNITVMFPMPLGDKTTRTILNSISIVGAYVDDDSVKNRHQIDSAQRTPNKLIMDVAKEIRVIGIKEISDSVISVYNEQGIKAAMQFVKRQPIIELAIPLKYLGLSVNDAVKFSYNIRINGMPDNNMPPPPPPPVMMGGGGIQPPVQIVGNGGGVANFIYSPTDFWGEYILVKSN